jgi:hypothetical protein
VGKFPLNLEILQDGYVLSARVVPPGKQNNQGKRSGHSEIEPNPRGHDLRATEDLKIEEGCAEKSLRVASVPVMPRRRGQLTALKVPGRKNKVTTEMMRIFVLSRRVNNATFFESSAIAFIAALSRKLASAIFFEASPISMFRRLSRWPIKLYTWNRIELLSGKSSTQKGTYSLYLCSCPLQEYVPMSLSASNQSLQISRSQLKTPSVFGILREDNLTCIINGVLAQCHSDLQTAETALEREITKGQGSSK